MPTHAPLIAVAVVASLPNINSPVTSSVKVKGVSLLALSLLDTS